MFNTKTATVNNEEFNSSYMPVGINENVTLKSVEVKKSPNGRDFLEVTFENEKGQTATMTEWKNEKNMWIKTDEELQTRDNQQFGRLLQILHCYYENIPDVEIGTFVEMISWIKNTLDKISEKDKQPLRLKVIYDNKGYTRVSGNGTFVEPMTVENSQIKLFKRDTLERPVVADTEPASDPLAGSIPSIPVPENNVENLTSADPNELPF